MGGLVLRRGQWRAGRGGGNGWQVWGDHRAGGATGDQVALADQQLVCRLHRASRQVQLRRQRAHCRYPVARAQAAVGNGLTKTEIELAIDRLGLAAVQREGKHLGPVIYALFGPVA
ncbi:hypothetical protein D3C76_1098950 [compost metagenome]